MKNKNENLLDDVYAAWSAHDLEGIVAHFTEDIVYEDLAMKVVNRGHQALREFIREVFRTMPDFRVRYVTRFASGEQGAGQWIINGTWNGEFEGVDCSGKKVEFTGFSLYRFRSGKICWAADCWDFCQIMESLGVLRESLRQLR